MEILGWLWWGIVKVLGIVWSFVWFLLGGWVATLVQLVILIGAVFAMKYGWRRAPQEMWSRAQTVGRFAWAWAEHRGIDAIVNDTDTSGIDAEGNDAILQVATDGDHAIGGPQCVAGRPPPRWVGIEQ